MTTLSDLHASLAEVETFSKALSAGSIGLPMSRGGGGTPEYSVHAEMADEERDEQLQLDHYDPDGVAPEDQLQELQGAPRMPELPGAVPGIAMTPERGQVLAEIGVAGGRSNSEYSAPISEPDKGQFGKSHADSPFSGDSSIVNYNFSEDERISNLITKGIGRPAMVGLRLPVLARRGCVCGASVPAWLTVCPECGTDSSGSDAASMRTERTRIMRQPAADLWFRG